VDGKPLTFTCTGSTFQVTDHLRCDFHFRAPWQPAAGERHTFTFREGNYHEDDFSVLRLTLGAAGRVELLRSVAPDENLMARPASDRKPGDGERLRTSSATFTLVDERARAVSKPA